MAKNIIKLNESDIQDLVRRTVHKIIKESKWAHNQDRLDWKNPAFDDDEKLDADYEDFLAKQQKPWTGEDLDAMYAEHMRKKSAKYANDPNIDADGVFEESEYQDGKKYGENLLAKSKDVDGLIQDLLEREKNDELNDYERGILDALVDPNDIDL